MIVKLLTEHHLEFLSYKGGCRGLSESTHVKIPHCWKSHALAQSLFFFVVSQLSCVLEKLILAPADLTEKLTFTLVSSLSHKSFLFLYKSQ